MQIVGQQGQATSSPTPSGGGGGSAQNLRRKSVLPIDAEVMQDLQVG